MRRHDGLLGVISIVLVISMLIGLGSVLAGAGFSEPENPLGSNSDPLIPEALDGGGKLAGSGEGEREETMPPDKDEPPTEPQETEQPTEPEESTAPSEPQETQPTEEPENDNETNPTESDDREEGEGDEAGGDQPDQEEGGSSDSGEEGDGSAGGVGEGSGAGGENPGSGDDNSPSIYTDLVKYNGLIVKADLPDGMLNFEAYPKGEGENLSVKVILKNSATGANGQTLQTADGKSYTAELVLNEKNTFILLLKKNGENIALAQFVISYEANKADEENPSVGKAPSIITNLDDLTEESVMETQDFLFWVSAKTHPDLGAKAITSERIQVWLNGSPVQKQTGVARPEYELHFEPPNVGDYADYEVKVLAWDGYGNSRMVIYKFRYHTVSEGDYLGTVNVVLDATTVGLGIIDSAAYKIVQGDTAAGVVIKFLEEYGYDAIYDGSATVGFYLRSISRGDLCSGASVPENLWSMILKDGIPLSGNSDRDSLGEYDYTMGSGWMYSINGSIYPGRGLSDYKLSNNTTIYLRFTLAYGKDIGGYDATGQGYGSLSSYCGIWISGGYTPLEHNFEETDRVEATETEDGYVEFTCTKCGETKQEVIPETQEPTEPEETEPPTEPEETEPEETEPPTEPEETEPPTEPEETNPPVTDPPETQPPETNPPVTDPLETEPPQVTETPTPSDDEEE